MGDTKYVSEALRNPAGITDLSTFTGFSTAITGTGEIYAALPRLSEGTGSHERVGDEVTPKSVKVKLDLYVKSYDDNSAIDRTVHVFLMTAKSVKSLDNYSAIPITTMLNKGDGSIVAFTGKQYDAQYPVNTKEFTVLKHKTMRVVIGFGKPYGTTSATAGSTDGVITPTGSYKRISMNVKVPQKLKYARDSAKYPTNSAPFVVIGWTRNDSKDTVDSGTFLNVIGQVQMYYNDS